MVRAWYIDGHGLDNPRDEHHRLPPKFIALEDLYRISGVEHHELNVDTYQTDGSWEKIKKDRGYNHEDILETPSETELQQYYKEHLHEDEEIRFTLEGFGYFDIRDKYDEWIRIEIASGDLIVIPGGCYHRFTLDRTNFIRLKRLFKKSSQWKSYPRPVDNLSCRQEYLKKLKSGAFEVEPAE